MITLKIMQIITTTLRYLRLAKTTEAAVITAATHHTKCQECLQKASATTIITSHNYE